MAWQESTHVCGSSAGCEISNAPASVVARAASNTRTESSRMDSRAEGRFSVIRRQCNERYIKETDVSDCRIFPHEAPRMASRKRFQRASTISTTHIQGSSHLSRFFHSLPFLPIFRDFLRPLRTPLENRGLLYSHFPRPATSSPPIERTLGDLCKANLWKWKRIAELEQTKSVLLRLLLLRHSSLTLNCDKQLYSFFFLVNKIQNILKLLSD